MALIDDQKIQFLNDIRSIADLFDLIRQRCMCANHKWNALGFGASGINEFIAADMTNTAYDGLSIANLTNCVSTIESFETWYGTGHNDNLQKIMS